MTRFTGVRQRRVERGPVSRAGFQIMPRIERDGVQIHYDDVGDGRPLVLLHGFLFHSGMWTPQVEELKKDFRIITIDFRGHGRSSPLESPITLYDHVTDVLAVLAECDVPHAVWVGLSMGGMVAMRAAIMTPESVEALVLLDTDSGVEDPMKRFRYRAMALGARYLGIRPFLPSIGRLVFGPTTHRERPGLVREWKKQFLDLDVSSVQKTLEALTKRDPLGPMLHEITVPALIIAGEEDRTLSPERSRQIAEGIAGSTLEIVGRAGHLSNLEQPEAVNDLLREFLNRSATGVTRAEAPEDETVKSEELQKELPEELAATEPGADEPDIGELESPSEPEQPDDRADELVKDEPAAMEIMEPVDDGGQEDSGVPAVAPPPSRSTRDAFEDYAPSGNEGSEAAEFMLSGGKKGRERRIKRRVAPSRKLYGRVGHVGILVVDISESGAKIEHYNRRFATRSKILLELEWEGRTVSAECEVVSCRVHRFIAGDKGATVYQSGLRFLRMSSESSMVLKELVGRLVTRGLAEQVANARGIGPVLQNDMPTFRSGVVSAGGRPKEAGSEGPSRLIRTTESVEQIGYIRCRKIGPRWEKKWTTSPFQPADGFTVLATENKLDIETLCETWDLGDEATKKFVRDCARASIGLESDEEKSEP